MEGKQQAAVYLICTKNSSFQRKHLEVCRRCESNTRCKAYLEYSRSLSAQKSVDPPTAADRSQLLNHMIQELYEIQKLAHDAKTSSHAAYGLRDIHLSVQDRVVLEIKAALEDIQRIANVY